MTETGSESNISNQWWKHSQQKIRICQTCPANDDDADDHHQHQQHQPYHQHHQHLLTGLVTPLLSHGVSSMGTLLSQGRSSRQPGPRRQRPSWRVMGPRRLLKLRVQPFLKCMVHLGLICGFIYS